MISRNDTSTQIDEKGNAGASVQLPTSLKKRIIETLTDGNRLTIIVGGTGCGKSTLVPQLLLDNIGQPILCTQPRRLAVVAVSGHVARQRGTVLGDEVGYHVGQNRVANNRTKLLFATAGILLEELKSNGVEALSKYNAVLIDECHERSAESDLCLVIIKSFMTKYPNANIRIILMSATFNQGKYTSYFHGVPGCEHINTITLETVQSINAFYKQVQTYYLEDIIKKIPRSTVIQDLRPFERTMRLDPDSEMQGDNGGKSLSAEILTVISALVSTLHEEEPSNAKFLIFAPTYRHLEQIHSQLSSLTLGTSSVLIDVLHSSIDLEDCLESMKEANNSHHQDQQHRHILLASAIADSSVTIPGVTCVIDTCRALQVKWDAHSEVHNAKTVWASKSICDQRRGRTGRTCAGRVFRLVNQSFYISRLDNWDQPQIESASCRDEILVLLSSINKIFSNPQALLKRCLDPPPDISVAKAIIYLQEIGACTIRRVGRKETLVPTDLGKLLASLPYTVSNSDMIVQGAKKGMLHEALVLVSILNTRPYPILHIFAENEVNEVIQKRFYNNVNSRDQKSVAVANFAAYLFWYINWKINIFYKQAMSRFLHCTKNSNECNVDYLNHSFNTYPVEVKETEALAFDCHVWEWNSETADAHTRWCKQHHINPTSVRAIDANVDVALKTLYHKDHEPEWLRYQTSASKWSKPTDAHANGLFCNDIFQRVYGYEGGIETCELLLELQDPSRFSPSQNTQQEIACIHFLNGNCVFGDQCKNVHSYTAPRPPCRYFRNGGCTNSSCLYSHKRYKPSAPTSTRTFPAHSYYDGGALTWFRNKAKNMLLFGEQDFSFTNALHSLRIHPSHATTNYSKIESGSIAERRCTLKNVDATRCHTNINLKAVSEHITTCVWNFPHTGNEEDDVIHTSLLSGAFLSVALYLRANIKHNGLDAEFAVSLQGDQLSRWSVLQSAKRAGFHLDWWEEFDHYSFPGYIPKRGNGERFPAQHARFYVFRLAD